MLTVNAVKDMIMPGDIGLTRNPQALGKLINFAQRLDGGDESRFGHVVIFAKEKGPMYRADGGIYESVTTISRNRISDYIGANICIMRHQSMTPERFFLGREEILDNLGQVYPFHRLFFCLGDVAVKWFKRVVLRSDRPVYLRMSKTLFLDWPVCSELAAQFILTAGLKGGWRSRALSANNFERITRVEDWRGINPDQFDDARVKRTDLWDTVCDGKLTA